MLYFTILLISSALPLISSQNDCALGEDYWCRSLSNAKACNAMKECLDVWRNSSGNEMHVTLCMHCRRIVSQLITLNNNKEIIQGICDILEHETERAACFEEVREWTPGDLEKTVAGLTCVKLDYCKLLMQDGGLQNEMDMIPRGRSRRKRFLDTLLKNDGDVHIKCCPIV